MKAKLRILKANLIRKNIIKKPIIILASRRGGSTLLADVVAANKGVWFANEPFAALPAHPGFALKKQLLPKREHSQYFDLLGDELKQFERYMSGLLTAEYSSLGTCRNLIFPFTANRVCLKILNAPWMLDWFFNRIDAHVIFLTRHPAAQALSVMRQGWGYGVAAYFNKPQVLATVFSDDQISLGFEILKRNNTWEVAILDWIICTHHGRVSKDRDLIKINYELLITKPIPFIEDVLISRLGLHDFNHMKTTINLPSNSSSMSTKNIAMAIIDGNKEMLLSDWTRKICSEEKRVAQNILDCYEVDEYKMDHCMPISMDKT